MDGYFNGVRIRKNFKTREEAAAEQTMLELKALNAANGLHTRLFHDCIHDILLLEFYG